MLHPQFEAAKSIGYHVYSIWNRLYFKWLCKCRVVKGPTISLKNSYTVCFVLPITLLASGANTYSWSGGATQGQAFVPVGSGIYTVVGTDINNCTASGMAAVSVVSLPTVADFANLSVCQTVGSVNLTATPAGGEYSGNGVSNGIFTP